MAEPKPSDSAVIDVPQQSGQGVKSADGNEKKRKRKNKPGAGRPTVMTEGIIWMLLEARGDGATDIQACLIAEISTTTYYKYCAEHPKFAEAMERAVDIKKVLANRVLRKGLEQLPPKERIDLAWQILKDLREDQDSTHRRDLERAQQMPGLSGGYAPRLVSGHPQQVNINVGPQQVAQVQQGEVIRAEDLTDRECERLARGEPLVSVLGDRKLAHNK